MNAPSLWLHTRRYDMFWYAVVPVLLLVALGGLSLVLGPRGPLTAYLASAMLTGLPHNMITWLLLLPRESRGYYQSGVLFGPFLLTSLVMVPTVLLYGTPAFAWAISLNIAIAYYHITRQHMGMLNACDGRYQQATGDTTIRALGEDMRWAIAGIAATTFAWKMTGGPMLLGLFAEPMRFVLQPIPMGIAFALTAATALPVARLLFKLMARHFAGMRFPAAHALMGGAAAANLIVASLVPNDQFFLTLALVASCHNMQYFAFCYTHHHLRAVSEPAADDAYSNWARARKWAPWFLLPIGLGVAFGVATTLVPPFWGTLLATWFMTSHYFVDGHMWRRKYYPRMGRFASGVVQPAGP